MLLEAALNVNEVNPQPLQGHMVQHNEFLLNNEINQAINPVADTLVFDNLNSGSYSVFANDLLDASHFQTFFADQFAWPPVTQGIVIREPAFSQASTQTMAHPVGALGKGKEKVQDGPHVSSSCGNNSFEVGNSSNSNQKINQPEDFIFIE